MSPRLFLLALATFNFCATPNSAREFWIEPHQYHIPGGAPLIANFRFGQNFTGESRAYMPRKSSRFDVIHQGQTTEVTPDKGDLPALHSIAPPSGLLVILHETLPASLTYRRWDTFQAFARHKRFPGIHARHLARDLPKSGFTESYTRHVKTLVGVGAAEGTDTQTGMEIEFVALTNPYTDDPSGGFVVALYYQGAPHKNAQIEVYDRNPDGLVTVTLEHTDDTGQAIIPVQSGHEYLLDAVKLREPVGNDSAAWETLWAALTFSVP